MVNWYVAFLGAFLGGKQSEGVEMYAERRLRCDFFIIMLH